MRIGIDVRFSIGRRRGIGNYSLNLIRWLAKIDRENEYFLYFDREDIERVLPAQENFHLRKFYLPVYPLWEQVVFPVLAALDRLDVVHSVGNTGPLFFFPSRMRRVTSVMDVMCLKDDKDIPQPTSYYQRLGRLYRRLVVPRVAKASAAIFTISQFSEADILRHIAGISPNILHVTYLAHDESVRRLYSDVVRARIADRLDVRGEFIFCLGAEDPRKNTRAAIRAYLALRAKYNIQEKLIICGLRNWRSSESYEDVKVAGEHESISFLDFVSPEDIVLLYNA